MHPKRQPENGVRMLVRAKELACRNSWGDDLWTEKVLHATTSPNHTHRSDAEEVKDDSVTLVTDTGSHHPARITDPREDQITNTTIRDDDQLGRDANDVNTPANDDQNDRVRSMARGNRDAILRARERKAQRRQPTRSTIEPLVVEENHATPGDQLDHTARSNDPDSVVQRMDGYAHTPPVPRDEIIAANRGNSLAVGSDNRFESAPTFQTDIELPRLRGFLQPDQRHQQSVAQAHGVGVANSSYERALHRAQGIKAQDQPASVGNSIDPGRQAIDQSHLTPSHDEENVVWDLERANDDIVVSRVRSMLSESGSALAEHDRRQQTVQGTPNNEVTVPPDSSRNVGEPSMEPNDSLLSTVSLSPADDMRETGGIRREPVESPQFSWWRSLNFGMRRRVFPDGEWFGSHRSPQPAHDDAWDADHEIEIHPIESQAHETLSSDDDKGFQGSFATDSSQSANDDFRASDANHSSAGDRRHIVHSDPFSSIDILIDGSSLAWFERQRELLERSPFAELKIPLPPVPEFAAPPGQIDQPPVIENQARVRTRHSYHVDDPAGYSEFSFALFGVDPARQIAPAVPNIVPDVAAPATRRPATPSSQGHDDAVAASVRPPAPPLDSRYRRAPGSELRMAFDEQNDVGRHFAVASSVRKCCRTCRSYEPGDASGSGRCGNERAFTYRQMVNADELSCQSSIGNWWLADDRAWIPPHIAIRPNTPHTDRLALQRQTTPETGMVMEVDRRVRTRKIS